MPLHLSGLFDPSRKQYLRGIELENQGKLDEAFQAYQAAAERGSADAMWAIAQLYLQKGFRKRTVNNLGRLLLSGGPIFPWNIEEREETNFPAALEWCRRAADLGHGPAALTAGIILCEGDGCAPDVSSGLPYLKAAVDRGVNGAKNALDLFQPPEPAGIGDAEYARLLREFERAVEEQSGEQSALYARLKSGSPGQLAKLGYALMAGKNLGKPGYIVFPFMKTADGIPVFPIAPKRVGWKTFIRIDRRAFPESARVLFASDICVEPDALQGLRIAGEAEYLSPAFGWLDARKRACVLEFDDSQRLAPEQLQEVAREFLLTPGEYLPDSVAFFTENGEKEYSVELCALVGDRVDVLYRYTIGGPDAVTNYFPPKLLKLSSPTK